jgi:hypothetical protein
MQDAPHLLATWTSYDTEAKPVEGCATDHQLSGNNVSICHRLPFC